MALFRRTILLVIILATLATTTLADAQSDAQVHVLTLKGTINPAAADT